MTDENITHGQKIKHTFKYGEQRRALWLNTHSKDEYGRHRSAILYGMNTVIAGDATLRIEPGAVVTPYGTRFFFEQFSSSQNPTFNVVDLTTIFERSADFPITVCVYLRFSYPDATIPPAVEDIASFDTQLVGFGFRVVPHDLEGVRPAINLTPRDPILLDRNQNNQNGDYTSSASVDVDKNSVYYKPATGETGDVDKLAEAAALQFGEIPLAYVIFGANPDTGEAPSTLSSPGVDIVKCSNVFSSISNILGHDVFFGRHGRRVVPLSDAADATALQQGYSVGRINDNATPELAAPKYGTGQPVTELISPVSDPTGQKLISDQDKDSWTQSDWSTYRKPNFLRDGDSVVWSLRRFDYIMRLWIDRTGDQALISAIQDGTLETPTSYTVLTITLESGPDGTDEIFIDGVVDIAWVGQTLTLSQGNVNDADNPYTVISVNDITNAIRVAHSGSRVATGQLGSLIVYVSSPSLPTHVRPMMTLDGILQHFRGNDRPLENVLDIVYATGDLVSSVNHVVKSGRPAHLPQTPENVSNTGYGDSHVNAISVLDRGVWHILNDIFGRDFARRAIRRNVTWRSGSDINSGPLGDDAVSMEAALRHDDGPTGRRPIADANGDGFTGLENNPTVTGSVKAAYLTLDDIYTAIGRIGDRAQSGGANWLRNPNFYFGSEDTVPDAPRGWQLSGSVWWARQLISEATELYAAGVEFSTAGRILQVVDFDGTTANENMLTMSLMHWAAAIKVLSGTIRIGVRGLTTSNTEVFTVIRAGITASSHIDNYSCAFTITGDPSTIGKLEFFVDSPDNAELIIYGTSMGPGVPPTSTFYDHNTMDYVSRDGGNQSAMRGPLYSQSFQAKQFADATDPQDLTTLSQNTTAIGVEAAARIAGDAAINTRIDNLPSIGAVYFKASGSWEVPLGVTRALVTIQAPGGGGGHGGNGRDNRLDIEIGDIDPRTGLGYNLTTRDADGKATDGGNSSAFGLTAVGGEKGREGGAGGNFGTPGRYWLRNRTGGDTDGDGYGACCTNNNAAEGGHGGIGGCVPGEGGGGLQGYGARTGGWSVCNRQGGDAGNGCEGNSGVSNGLVWQPPTIGGAERVKGNGQLPGAGGGGGGGGGASCDHWWPGSGGGGAAAGQTIRRRLIEGLTPGDTHAIVVGAAGLGGRRGKAGWGGDGGPGYVLIEWGFPVVS